MDELKPEEVVDQPQEESSESSPVETSEQNEGEVETVE